MVDKTLVPIEKFGRDHWSLLAYIECRCVDHKGIPDFSHMRCNEKNHPQFISKRAAIFGMPCWEPKYGTRLKGHTTESFNQIQEHDDWDCVDDLEAAELIEWNGTGMHPVFKLTKLGKDIASQIRNWKQNGHGFATFHPSLLKS